MKIHLQKDHAGTDQFSWTHHKEREGLQLLAPTGKLQRRRSSFIDTTPTKLLQSMKDRIEYRTMVTNAL